MSRLITCGFDNQLLAAEMPGSSTSSVSGSASITADTTLKFCGDSSIKMTSAASANCYIEFRADTNYNDTFFRVYVYFTTLGAASRVNLIKALNSSGIFRSYISLETDDTLSLRSAGGTKIGSSSATLTTGKWYGIGFENRVGGSPYTQAAYLWEDGNAPAIFASGNIINEAAQRIRVDMDSVAGTVVNVDNVVWNNGEGSNENSFPEVSKIIYLRPNAAGSSNQWLKNDGSAGDANNYQLVDDLPVSTTGYIKRTTSSQPIDEYNIQSPTGLGGSETIKCLTVNGYVGATSALDDAARTLFYRLKTASDTLSESASRNIAVNGYVVGYKAGNDGFVSYTNPDTSVAWTVSNLTDVKIGVKAGSTATTEIRVADMWLAVDYKEAGAGTVMKTVNSTWNVLANVAKTTSTTWNVRDEVAKTVATTFNVLQSVSKTVATTWNVASDRSPVSNTFNTTWNVAETVSKTISTTWNVAGNIMPVSKTLDTTWNVLRSVAKTVTTSWNLGELIQKSLNTSWNSLNAIESATVTLISPLLNTVPSVRPKFLVLISSVGVQDYQVELQVSDSINFINLFGGSPITHTPLYVRGGTEKIFLSDDLSDMSKYYWRVRLVRGAQVSAWTAPSSFFVNVASGNNCDYLTFNVTAAAESQPVLWFTSPQACNPGDDVTLFGYGLNQGTDSILIDGSPVTPSSWSRVSAVANAYTIDRSIDSIAATCDTEHDEVVITIPEGNYTVGATIEVTRG